MDGGFDRERRIADASRARHERDNDRQFSRGIVSRAGALTRPTMSRISCGESGLGDPVGVSGLNEPFVVAGGNVAANDDEEQVSRMPPDDVDQIVDVCNLGRRDQDDADRSAPLIDFGRCLQDSETRLRSGIADLSLPSISSALPSSSPCIR